MMTENDKKYLLRCIELAREALDDGDEPFGSLLVSASGEVLFEDRNCVSGGDKTRHPELAIARWAAANMTPQERAKATVYTSGEHCPMCAAAHGWVGLGTIVFASSSQQLAAWLQEFGVAPSPVSALSIRTVVPDLKVIGPIAGLDQKVYELHRERHNSAN